MILKLCGWAAKRFKAFLVGSASDFPAFRVGQKRFAFGRSAIELPPKASLAFYDEQKLHAASQGHLPELMQGLLERAEEALGRGPYSVVDKTTFPPSGDPHDYWHPAPYWWPNPDTESGLPYVWRDGERIPGTQLHGPDSEQYDRSRLQQVFDDTTILALAWRVHGQDNLLEHAARLIRVWFIDPRTRMTPHLRYAQVRRGHNNDEGASTGLIEMKDLYYFLDAVRIVGNAGALSPAEVAAFDSWLLAYFSWLGQTKQSNQEMRRTNNHGTMFDVQVAAIAIYLGHGQNLAATSRRAHKRLLQQIAHDGSQPHELWRANTRHYCCFNLQGWTTLSRLLDSRGQDLWNYMATDDCVIRRALEWLLSSLETGSWPYPDQGSFDRRRLWPLLQDYEHHYGNFVGSRDISDELGPPTPLMHPDDGIAPYWMLARN